MKNVTLSCAIALLGMISAASALAASYDESVNHAPPFSVNQNDPALSDLFNPQNGQSGLCVPTTLANIVAEQALWRTPPFPQLGLVQQPEQGDYTQQVRYFAQACGTDPIRGTVIANAAQCMRSFYEQSGYSDGWVYLIGIEEGTDPMSVQFWHGPRQLSIDDIRYYVSNQVGVLMDVYWEQAPQAQNNPGPWNPGYPGNPVYPGPGGFGGASNWIRRGGHTFMIAGYDYDYSWGQDQILLKVVNPEHTYDGNPADDYDEIQMTSAEASPGISFPPGFSYVLSGKGFPSTPVRGYVRNIMVFLPDHSVQPASAQQAPLGPIDLR